MNMPPTSEDDYELVDSDLYSAIELELIADSMKKLGKAAANAVANVQKLAESLAPKTKFETDLLQMIKEQKEEQHD